MVKRSLPPRAHVASFEVDAQNCFTPLCPDELPVFEGHHIVPELNAQAELAEWRLGSKEAHSPHAIWCATPEKPIFTPIEAENADVHWPVHAVPGTVGFERLEGLPPISEYDYFVWKGVELDLHPYGVCFHDLKETLSTGVVEFLKYHAITTVIVGGLATDYCVKVAVLQLLRAGFEVILNVGACRGISKATTEAAISEMESKGAVIVESASCLVNQEKQLDQL